MTSGSRWVLPFPDPRPPRHVDSSGRKALDAQLRACPAARMIDYGASQAEADFYTGAVRDGWPWQSPGLLLADRRMALADHAARMGAVDSEAAHRRAASALAGLAQLSEHTDTASKRRMYLRVVHEYAASAALGDTVKLDDGSSPWITGWLRLPEARPAPVVLVWGGLSGWGPAYHRGTEELIRRGVGVVLVELPGQGEPRLERHSFLDGGFIGAVERLVTAILSRKDVAPGVGIWGNSVGGLFALHVAASGLAAACCVNSFAGDPVVMTDRFPRLLSQFGAMFGIGDPDGARTALAVLGADRAAEAITCPLLVLHGAADRLVTVHDVVDLCERCPSADKTLISWETGEHCLYSFAEERDITVAEWFASRLGLPNRR